MWVPCNDVTKKRSCEVTPSLKLNGIKKYSKHWDTINNRPQSFVKVNQIVALVHLRLFLYDKSKTVSNTLLKYNNNVLKTPIPHHLGSIKFTPL